MGAQAEAAVTPDTAPDAPVTLVGVPPIGWDLPRAGRLQLGPRPAGWTLDRVARSHGWCGLPPSAYDPVRQRFHRTLALPDAGPLTVTVDAHGTVSWGRTRGTASDRAAIKRQLRRMLGVDDDISALQAACAATPWLAWVPASGAGRLLRSPTVWEDLARMLATTNCSWALTRLMLTRLVDSLGAEGPAGERAFPTRDAVAAAGPTHFREVVRAGYRSESFVALANTAEPIESWLATPAGPVAGDDDVLAGIQRLRGFGPYAAEGMLGLLGRPRGFGIDSWVRSKLPTLLGVPSLTDAEIRGRYAQLGSWAGWGLWLELTRDWFDGDGTMA
jgi:3-methyladenine DNA glycosylase/8-oxoguanine DNA glycosylase